MKKIVHYIGLDVHKETIAVAIAPEGGCEGTDILAALARLRRKMREMFLCRQPRVSLADSLYPGLSSFAPPGIRNGLRLVFGQARDMKTEFAC